MKYIQALRILLKFIYIKFICGVTNFEFSYKNICGDYCSFHFNKSSKVFIGKMFSAKNNLHIEVSDDAVLNIGDNVFFNHNCIINCHERIEIGTNVKFGPNVIIYDHDHDFHDSNWQFNYKYKTKPIYIGKGAWIGANVIILKGAIIGDNSVIGAGCTVTGHIPNNTVVIQKSNLSYKEYRFYK